VNTYKQPVFNLMSITGVMLILFAIPIGVETIFLVHFTGHTEWYWAIAGGSIMTITMAVIGIIFLSVGNSVVKRRWKLKEQAKVG
jgi:hypothetical protein